MKGIFDMGKSRRDTLNAVSDLATTEFFDLCTSFTVEMKETMSSLHEKDNLSLKKYLSIYAHVSEWSSQTIKFKLTKKAFHREDAPADESEVVFFYESGFLRASTVVLFSQVLDVKELMDVMSKYPTVFDTIREISDKLSSV